jgi:CRP-like cAMP-binding protein
MNMDTFKQYISQDHSMTAEDWLVLDNMSTPTRLKKEEHLVQRNAVFEQEVFIEKGIMRAYVLDDEGNEKSVAFFTEGAFMSIASLRTKNGRSLYHYQAMCDTEVLLFPSKALQAFFSNKPYLSHIGSAIKAKEMERLSNRDLCLLQVKAKDKYLNFLKSYPNIELHISQKHIASYLGITPVSLSRVKASLKRRATDNN